MESLATLNAAQTARLMTLPEQAVAPFPMREAMLEGFRQRNAAVDAMFYDLSALHSHESADLAPHYAAEGAILTVQNSDHADVRLWPDYDAFRASSQTGAARAIAIAGLGSSALGAAAFARNVADAVDGPVLSVVSGYGLGDLVAESLGGLFWFSALGSMRHLFEPLDNFLRPHHSTFAFSKAPSLDGLQGSLDVKTLTALLAGHDFDVIVGHSKGNMVISEALFALAEIAPERAEALAKTLRIVTIGARVPMPAPFRSAISIIGEYDSYGQMNSRDGEEATILVPNAGHHTNTEIPYHLDVTNAVAKALKLPLEPEAAGARAEEEAPAPEDTAPAVAAAEPAAPEPAAPAAPETATTAAAPAAEGARPAEPKPAEPKAAPRAAAPRAARASARRGAAPKPAADTAAEPEKAPDPAEDPSTPV